MIYETFGEIKYQEEQKLSHSFILYKAIIFQSLSSMNDIYYLLSILTPATLSIVKLLDISYEYARLTMILTKH